MRNYQRPTMQRFAFLFAFALLCFLPSMAQDSNILELGEGNESPAATLSDIAWIEGHWRGKAFGGDTEEIWSPPMGGSMMGSFRLVVEGSVSFYELMTISEVGSTLLLRIKHFDRELRGWEEKDKSVEFKLVRVTPGKVYFDGLTFEKISENEINVYVNLDDKEKKSEQKFSYHRYKSQ